MSDDLGRSAKLLKVAGKSAPGSWNLKFFTFNRRTMLDEKFERRTIE
jgi:hypothetical protein